MFGFTTNNGTTRWACLAFETVSTSDGITNTYTIVPTEEKTVGARFVSFVEDPPASGLFVVTYSLDFLLQFRERIQLASCQVDGINGAFDPFIPLPLPFQAVPEDLFKMVVITNGKIQPPDSVIRCVYNVMIERSIPDVLPQSP